MKRNLDVRADEILRGASKDAVKVSLDEAKQRLADQQSRQKKLKSELAKTEDLIDQETLMIEKLQNRFLQLQAQESSEKSQPSFGMDTLDTLSALVDNLCLAEPGASQSSEKQQ